MHVPGADDGGRRHPRAPAAGDEGRLDLASLLEGKYGGRIVSESYARTARPVMGDQVITLGISTGGTGYGDPLDRDPEAVERDLVDGMISEWAAANVYGVRFNAQTGRIDPGGTEELRAERMRERIAGGKSWTTSTLTGPSASRRRRSSASTGPGPTPRSSPR